MRHVLAIQMVWDRRSASLLSFNQPIKLIPSQISKASAIVIIPSNGQRVANTFSLFSSIFLTRIILYINIDKYVVDKYMRSIYLVTSCVLYLWWVMITKQNNQKTSVVCFSWQKWVWLWRQTNLQIGAINVRNRFIYGKKKIEPSTCACLQLFIINHPLWPSLTRF